MMNQAADEQTPGNLSDPLSEIPPSADDAPESVYSLEVDKQVSKFLELNHKITFFIITASIATFAFSLNFATSDKVDIEWTLCNILIGGVSAIVALLTSAFSLIALSCDIKSFRKHLKYRYQKKEFEDLETTEQASWERINSCAARSRKWSFIFLVITIALQVALVGKALIEKGETEMHHYGKPAIEVRLSADKKSYMIAFKNKETKAVIRMNIPIQGAFADPTKKMTKKDLEALATKVARTLATVLDLRD